MNKTLLQPARLRKRLGQIAHLALHPFDHVRCMLAVARSPAASTLSTPFKYLGDHLALSLRPDQRRQALMGHHTIIGEALSRRAASDIGDGLILWKRDVPGEQPLMLVLEPSRLAPMEGELQLTFRHLSDLHVLTFSFAPGHVFNCARNNVLFIGGIQGLRGCRDEIRAASKRNGEIAPVAMLLLGVQAIAKAIGLRMVAVGESDQISTSYSASMIRFNYDAFWAQVGGSHVEHFYFVPVDPPQRDLSTIQLTHRSRTRRKRREKKAIRESIEASVKQLLTRSDPLNRLRSPAHRQRRGAEGPMKTERQLWASYCTPA